MAGTGRPAWAIMASSAVVLSVTVLPPVLGPLMMSWRSAAVSSSVSGTTVAAGRAQMPFEQRMAGGFQAQQIGRNGRGHAVVVAGKAGAGLQAIDQRQHARAFDQAMSVAAHLAGERDKDAVNLGLLFFDQAHQFVVLLDGFQRLDVNRLPRGAGAVNHAADAPLQLGADGNDEAVAANGDEVFLGCAVLGELAQGGAQAFFDEPLLALLLAADAAQLGRGVVGQRAVGLNGALDGSRPADARLRR